MSKIEEKLTKLEDKIDQLSEQLRTTERKTYSRGLIVGFLFGILGNMFVSYLMKHLEGSGMPSWGWTLGTYGSLAGIGYLIWKLDRNSRK